MELGNLYLDLATTFNEGRKTPHTYGVCTHQLVTQILHVIHTVHILIINI
jgi:hypothetical protein